MQQKIRLGVFGVRSELDNRIGKDPGRKLVL